MRTMMEVFQSLTLEWSYVSEAPITDSQAWVRVRLGLLCRGLDMRTWAASCSSSDVGSGECCELSVTNSSFILQSVHIQPLCLNYECR